MPIYNQFTIDQQTNQPSPAGLQRGGPVIAVEISLHPTLVSHLQNHNLPIPTPVTGLGLIDTGATVTAVDAAALQGLQIPPVGTMTVHTPAGSQPQQQYPARIQFPGTPLPAITFTFVIGANLTGQGLMALIGRDVLQHFVMVYNGPIGQIILSF